MAIDTSSCPTIFCRSASSKSRAVELRFLVSNSVLWAHCVAVAMTPPSLSWFEKPIQAPNSLGEVADGAQNTPPVPPFRYPGNFIGEGVSFVPRFRSQSEKTLIL